MNIDMDSVSLDSDWVCKCWRQLQISQANTWFNAFTTQGFWYLFHSSCEPLVIPHQCLLILKGKFYFSKQEVEDCFYKHLSEFSRLKLSLAFIFY